MSVLSLDWETRSAVDLRKAGAHRYAEDPSTDIWCGAWALDDGPVQVWTPGEPCPIEIVLHVADGDMVAGWNVGFERVIWKHIAGPRYGWPVPALEQFEDTAAAAAAMGLPRNLGDAVKAMGSPHEKDDAGRRLMLQMAKPRRSTASEPGLRWWDDEDRRRRLYAYCADDVRAERALREKLIPLGAAERETWLFDSRMNDRGVAIDVPLVKALISIVEQEKARLDAEMAEVTGGAVTACTQVSRLVEWLQDQGVPAESLAKAAIEDLLVTGLPEQARAAILLRKEAAKSSTAKLVAMLACVCADGRARGLHLYHGAGTGRWSGRLIQTQNMPRGTGTVGFDKEAKRVEKWPRAERDAAMDAFTAAAREDFMRGDAGWIRIIYGNVMSAVSDMLRACLVGEPGKRFLAADFSAIEGRVTAWLAGEAWKITAFEAADAGGPGIYELTAAGILSKPVEQITRKERQSYGKVPELALGFQGGVLAFHAMAKTQYPPVDMADAFAPLEASTDTETWEKAEKRYDECLERLDTGTDVMTREAWIASEVTKVLWRKKHPATVALWRGLEEAAFDATIAPGKQFSFRGIAFVQARGFLWMRLPSGRCLAYGAPKVQDREQPWGGVKATVTALGVDSTTKQWRRFALYGGLLAENAIQAIARDCMRDGMLAVEAAGYDVVLTVHDEAVAEVDEDFGSLAEFEKLLASTLPCHAGLPVVATGYEARRYRKD